MVIFALGEHLASSADFLGCLLHFLYFLVNDAFAWKISPGTFLNHYFSDYTHSLIAAVVGCIRLQQEQAYQHVHMEGRGSYQSIPQPKEH